VLGDGGGRLALGGNDPPRDRDESGMRDHPVERPDGLTVDIPRAEQRLERLEQAER